MDLFRDQTACEMVEIILILLQPNQSFFFSTEIPGAVFSHLRLNRLHLLYSSTFGSSEKIYYDWCLLERSEREEKTMIFQDLEAAVMKINHSWETFDFTEKVIHPLSICMCVPGWGVYGCVKRDFGMNTQSRTKLIAFLQTVVFEKGNSKQVRLVPG